MKKILSVSLTLLMLLGLFSGCAANAGNIRDDKKISVVATIFPQYDFTREIAGEYADISMLLSPGAEAHSYEPTPQDIIKIQNCDLFIYVGGESDAWIADILDSLDLENTKVISLMDIVDVVEEETVEGMEAEHEHEHEGEEGEEAHADEHEHEEGAEEEAHGEEIEYDEHVWTSPKNAMRITQAISDKLCEIDAVHADAYKANTSAYLERLSALDVRFQEVVESAKRSAIVFGDRFPLRYFVDAYGLKYSAAFPGCSTETEPSAATVAYLIDKVKADGIPVVFYIELSNHKIADTIAEATGAKSMQFNTCHNLTKDAFDAGATYLTLMEENVGSLKEALN